MLERYGRNGVLLIGRGVAYRKTGLHGILFISTVDSLHRLLFIHRRPPPASTCDCSSTGLLFIQPPSRATPPATVQPALSTGSCSTTPPRATVHSSLHHLLFIQPSTGWSCSSSPPRGPVQPAPTGSIDRGTVHPEATPWGHVHPPHRELFIQPPRQRSLFIQRQHRSSSVSSSSEGIARSGSVNSHRSIARV